MPFPEGGPNARKAGLPEKCSKEEAKAFARDAWTDEYEAKFDAAATDGKVARSAILAEVPATNKGLVVFFVKLTDPTKFKVEYFCRADIFRGRVAAAARPATWIVRGDESRRRRGRRRG